MCNDLLYYNIVCLSGMKHIDNIIKLDDASPRM